MNKVSFNLNLDFVSTRNSTNSEGNLYENFLQNNSYFNQFISRKNERRESSEEVPSLSTNTENTYMANEGKKDCQVEENFDIYENVQTEDNQDHPFKSRIFETNFNNFLCEGSQFGKEHEFDYTYFHVQDPKYLS